ncbi:helix-turn-helix domain-containing protein [Campylobacter upsaliensis]|nr:bacteriophage CI repressor [Campylobacter upsaliensis]EAI8238347.1 bacteriophage CI repressor [Campylobacter upsaliensis]EAJ1957265.1 bacteriophage CI repressor [Campylobacter upsaliensis]EAJ2282701.1 bacteriophage CI repressor [Campylobacter upsaliensis]EAJ4502092.1 bacteriophage CI repressor [Campylobacter upsaliensis]
MDKVLFLNMMKELGCKNKKELAKILNMPYNSVNNWGNVQKFPPYVEPFLNALVKAKKYDEALSGRNLGLVRDEVGCDEPLKVKQELEKLRLENAKLREELEKFERYKEALRAIL